MSVDKLRGGKSIVSQRVQTFHTKKSHLTKVGWKDAAFLEPSDPWVAMHLSTEKALSSIAEPRSIPLGLTKCFPSVKPINILDLTPKIIYEYEPYCAFLL